MSCILLTDRLYIDNVRYLLDIAAVLNTFQNKKTSYGRIASHHQESTHSSVLGPVGSPRSDHVKRTSQQG